jgi:hypothetical protein
VFPDVWSTAPSDPPPSEIESVTALVRSELELSLASVVAGAGAT